MAVTKQPDLLDETFYADLDGMHETFTWLRANDPVYRDPATGMIGVTRHRDLVDVERRGIAAEDRIRARAARDLGEHVLLERHALEDGLDHDIRRRAAVVADDAADPGEAFGGCVGGEPAAVDR